MRQVVFLLAAAFLVVLGVTIGTRMSSDAVAVLVGVVAGVAASIPTALLLMAVTRRGQEERREPIEERYRAQPPVIVVTPGSSPQSLPQYPAYQPYEARPGQRRQFRVMGHDPDEEPAEADQQAEIWY
jgi:hypothetical protein